jgi:anti-sigma regulatory factor (Ser/Thr protein kinase)
MSSATESIPASPVAPRLARRTVAEFLGTQVSRRFAEDASLLTSELVSNSVIHAGMSETDLIRLDLDLDLDRLRVTVSDAEGPFASTPTRVTGGWGLVLVERVSDRWGVRSDPPNSVWFELDR